MRTSRIAKDTAAVIEALSPRRTRSGLASPAASTASSRTASTRTGRRSALVTKLNGAVSPSSRTGGSGLEIEDAPFDTSAPASNRKRKRAGTTAEPAAGAAAATPARRSQRTVPIKNEEDGDSDLDSTPLPAAGDDAEPSEEDKDTHISSATNGARPPKSMPARRVKDAATGQVTIHAPSRWELHWEACAAMRARIPAPVDTVGCDRLHDATAAARDQRYQTLVALMLSPQTKDGVTAAAMERLRAALGRSGFNVAGMLATDEDTLDALINPVGFHRTKARHIRAASAMLEAQHASDVPKEPEDLMALPGVGPKIAYLCLSAAWGDTRGIGVDTHVHRITNRWNWHRTNTPEETRKMLESWLPRDKWAAINHMLVGFGQTVCTPIGPRCGECQLADQNICPAAVRGVKNQSPKKGRSVLQVYSQEEAKKRSHNIDMGVVKRLDADASAEVKKEVEVE